MLINYPRKAAHPDTPTWTFQYALGKAGVDAATTATLIQKWTAEDWVGVRNTFNQWNAIMQSRA